MKNREGSFTLSLLADGAGYATGHAWTIHTIRILDLLNFPRHILSLLKTWKRSIQTAP